MGDQSVFLQTGQNRIDRSLPHLKDIDSFEILYKLISVVLSALQIVENAQFKQPFAQLGFPVLEAHGSDFPSLYFIEVYLHAK